MKKRLTIFLITLLAIGPLMGLWPLKAQAYTFSGGGDGTPGNPYIITTAADLDGVRDDLTASYKLQADIDLSSFSSWQPIGIGTDSSNWFTGYFDGADYTISGMKINSNANYIGLFGYVRQPATIRNVRMENVDITSGNTNANVGGLVGVVSASSNYNALDRISVTGEIRGSVYTAGGVAGQLSYAALSNSDAHVRIDAGNTYAGGAVGINSNGRIEQSYATGDVSSSRNAGGLVGWSQNSSQLNSYATGDVTGVDNVSSNLIGGLSGVISSGRSIENSYAVGFVRKGSGSQTGSKAGGLAGSSDGNIINSYWNSDDDNSGLQTIGGVLGSVGAMSREDMKQIDIAGVGWDLEIGEFKQGRATPT